MSKMFMEKEFVYLWHCRGIMAYHVMYWNYICVELRTRKYVGLYGNPLFQTSADHIVSLVPDVSGMRCQKYFLAHVVDWRLSLGYVASHPRDFISETLADKNQIQLIKQTCLVTRPISIETLHKIQFDFKVTGLRQWKPSFDRHIGLLRKRWKIVWRLGSVRTYFTKNLKISHLYAFYTCKVGLWSAMVPFWILE